MHEPGHTLCIVKQIVEFPIACRFTYIGLKQILSPICPKMSQFLMGMFHKFFPTFLVKVPLIHGHLAISKKGVGLPNGIFWPFEEPNHFLDVNLTSNSLVYKWSTFEHPQRCP